MRKKLNPRNSPPKSVPPRLAVNSRSRTGSNPSPAAAGSRCFNNSGPKRSASCSAPSPPPGATRADVTVPNRPANRRSAVARFTYAIGVARYVFQNFARGPLSGTRARMRSFGSIGGRSQSNRFARSSVTPRTVGVRSRSFAAPVSGMAPRNVSGAVSTFPSPSTSGW